MGDRRFGDTSAFATFFFANDFPIELETVRAEARGVVSTLLIAKTLWSKAESLSELGLQGFAWQFGANGVPEKQLDWTDHGRPGSHTNPQVHDYFPTGGTPMRGPARSPYPGEL
ncbi:MAG: hypothetical protein ACKVPX_03070 [Myxococcaceae bacterium]